MQEIFSQWKTETKFGNLTAVGPVVDWERFEIGLGSLVVGACVGCLVEPEVEGGRLGSDVAGDSVGLAVDVVVLGDSDGLTVGTHRR